MRKVSQVKLSLNIFDLTGEVRLTGESRLFFAARFSENLPGNFGTSVTKMDISDHFGLPKLVVDLLSQQSEDNGLNLKWKMYSSGNYTELKLIWCPKSMEQRAKYSISHKPPSALKRDKERKQSYLAKVRGNVNARNSSSVNVSTQCDISVSQNKRITRSQTKQIVADCVENPRNSDPISDDHDLFTLPFESPSSVANDSVMQPPDVSPMSTMSQLTDQQSTDNQNDSDQSPDVTQTSCMTLPPGAQPADLSSDLDLSVEEDNEMFLSDSAKYVDPSQDDTQSEYDGQCLNEDMDNEIMAQISSRLDKLIEIHDTLRSITNSEKDGQNMNEKDT